MASGKNQLSYAMSDTRRHRTWLRRVCVIALLLIASWAAGFQWRREIASQFARLRMLRYQRACIESNGSPMQVIYEEDAHREFEIRRGWRRLNMPHDAKCFRHEEMLVAEPECWLKYAPSVPGLWHDGAPDYTTNRDPPATALLHGYRTTGGSSRIALLELRKSGEDSASWALCFRYTIISPGSLRQDPKVLARGAMAFDSLLDHRDPRLKRLRFYAAEFQKHSSSSFTIRYELDQNEEGFFDGQILDDSISLLHRAGSALDQGKSYATHLDATVGPRMTWP